MAGKMEFHGRVAIVTGAGGGLGREYALALAKRGAMVVVNDLGGSRHGDGKSTKLADSVVEEIKAFGGKAVANYDSVEDGEKVIETAIKAFGKVDILINNAGILRDRSFVKMTDNDWDSIMRVHLRGAYKMTQAAWNHFRKQKYGRIIMTSSNAGTQGNFGQANYSSAKMGLIGLTKTLAIEGAKYNISCNVIIPLAGSRLTKGIIPDDFLDNLKAKYIAPIVLYLCHESCPSSGDIYMSAAGVVQKIRLQNSAGHQFLKYGDDFGPEHIRDHWSDVETFGTEEMPKDVNTIMMSMMKSATEAQSNAAENPEVSNSSNADNPEQLIGLKAVGNIFNYSAKDVIMYALSIGATVDGDNVDDLHYLYENDDRFSTIPTFGVIPAMFSSESVILKSFVEKGYDMVKVLHGEQYLELFAPFPTSGALTSTAEVVDIVDKGKGMLALIDVKSYNEKDELVCYNQTAIFFVGYGGYGGKRTSSVEKKLVDGPKRSPDHILEQVVPTNQAALYRLNQDRNPIHIDPKIAQMAGFSTPILHGLCTYGYATRHILKAVANNDASKFKAIKARFSSPVLPGQTLVTQMWVERQRVHFEVLVKETGKKAITGGYLDLTDVPSKTPGINTETPSVVTTDTSPVEKLFAEVEERLHSSPDLAKSINAVVVYDITGDSNGKGTWVLDLRSLPAKIFKGIPPVKPAVTITISGDYLVALTTGKLNAMTAYMQKKLKVTGNMGLAQKMNKLFNTQPKL